MKKLLLSFRYVLLFGIYFVLPPNVLADDLLSRLPKVMQEETWKVPIGTDKDSYWRTNSSKTLSTFQEGDFQAVVWSYTAIANRHPPAIFLDLEPDHPVVERLRLRFRGDNSKNILRVSCYFDQTDQWHNLVEFHIDFEGWKTIEISADSPLHRFHKGVKTLKFEVLPDPEANSVKGELSLGDLRWVNPVFLEGPLHPSDAPVPMFNTWGGASAKQIQIAVDAGVGMHMLPIGFFDKPLEQRVQFAAERIPEIQKMGIMPGIAFYNHPGNEWIQEHPELMVKNQDGEVYKGGGAHTSPWNPEARKLWVEHIQDCLKELERQGVLDSVNLVMINPGEEGEVSYAWNKVWAHDPYAKKAWRTYLRNVYSSLDALNADLGTAYNTFEEIEPPSSWFPDREHAVFSDFYRLSMLRFCVEMTDAVRSVWEPEYWLWMTHSVGSNPQRFNSARYPLFYVEQLSKLGLIDYAHIAALNWQTREDVAYLQKMGVKIIGEVDVVQRVDRLRWTFDQCKLFRTDGMFIGTAEPLSNSDGRINEVGIATKEGIANFRILYKSDEWNVSDESSNP